MNTPAPTHAPTHAPTPAPTPAPTMTNEMNVMVLLLVRATTTAVLFVVNILLVLRTIARTDSFTQELSNMDLFSYLLSFMSIAAFAWAVMGFIVSFWITRHRDRIVTLVGIALIYAGTMGLAVLASTFAELYACYFILNLGYGMIPRTITDRPSRIAESILPAFILCMTSVGLALGCIYIQFTMFALDFHQSMFLIAAFLLAVLILVSIAPTTRKPITHGNSSPQDSLGKILMTAVQKRTVFYVALIEATMRELHVLMYVLVIIAVTEHQQLKEEFNISVITSIISSKYLTVFIGITTTGLVMINDARRRGSFDFPDLHLTLGIMGIFFSLSTMVGCLDRGLWSLFIYMSCIFYGTHLELESAMIFALTGPSKHIECALAGLLGTMCSSTTLLTIYKASSYGFRWALIACVLAKIPAAFFISRVRALFLDHLQGASTPVQTATTTTSQLGSGVDPVCSPLLGGIAHAGPGAETDADADADDTDILPFKESFEEESHEGMNSGTDSDPQFHSMVEAATSVEEIDEAAARPE